jgi:hypothetical protein
MKAGLTSEALLILNISSKWKEMVSFMLCCFTHQENNLWCPCQGLISLPTAVFTPVEYLFHSS